MSPQDFDRIRFLTRHFRQLQGLRWMVPGGLLFLSLGLGPMFAPDQPALLLAVLAGAVFLSLRSRDFYRERFGEVEPRPLKIGERPLEWVPVLAVMGIEELGKRGLYPVSLCLYASAGLLFVFTFFWGIGEGRRHQSHYLVLGALFLFLALAGSAVAAFLPGMTRPGVDLILCGCAMILAGLLDHQFLVQTLERLGAPLPAAPAG